MLGIFAGLLFGNAVEWYAHKYVLHGVKRGGQQGRYSPRPSSMKFHWEHHKHVRLNDYSDDVYLKGYGRHNPRVFNEVNSLLMLCVATTLAAPFAPFFTLTTYYCAANYLYKHRRSHLDPEWGKKHLPWHYDHHMNTNQDANWCVTKPWFDYLMGTRVISDGCVKETNPLGIRLPEPLETGFNALVRKTFPKIAAQFEKN